MAGEQLTRVPPGTLGPRLSARAEGLSRSRQDAQVRCSDVTESRKHSMGYACHIKRS